LSLGMKDGTMKKVMEICRRKGEKEREREVY
jgi:hypothetical protein